MAWKKGKRKVQGVPQSQTEALPRPQEKSVSGFGRFHVLLTLFQKFRDVNNEYEANLRLYGTGKKSQLQGTCIWLLNSILLRKQAYSNILKILPPKSENFQMKILIFFIFLLKT